MGPADPANRGERDMTTTAHRAIEIAAERFYAARYAYYEAIDECARHYTDERWQRIGTTETAYRAARDRLDAAEAEA